MKARVVKYTIILVLLGLVWQETGHANTMLRPKAVGERIETGGDIIRSINTIDFSLTNFQFVITYNSPGYFYSKENIQRDATSFALVINRHFPYIKFSPLQGLLFHVLDNALEHSINKQGVIYVTIAGKIIENELRLQVSNLCNIPLPRILQDKVFYPGDRIWVLSQQRDNKLLHIGGLGLSSIANNLLYLFENPPLNKRPNVRWRDEEISGCWNITFELRLPIPIVLNRQTDVSTAASSSI